MKYASDDKQIAHNNECHRLYSQLQSAKQALYEEHKDWRKVFESPVYQDAELLWREKYNSCPECQSSDVEVVDYDPMWRDGDVVCKRCHTYVRGYDAG